MLVFETQLKSKIFLSHTYLNFVLSRKRLITIVHAFKCRCIIGKTQSCDHIFIFLTAMGMLISSSNSNSFFRSYLLLETRRNSLISTVCQFVDDDVPNIFFCLQEMFLPFCPKTYVPQEPGNVKQKSVILFQ